MKKFLATSLLILYIVFIAHPGEIAKLPLLVKHYKIHHSLNPGMTFWDFFSEHYLEDGRLHKDFEEDMKLPFKKAINCVNDIASYINSKQLVNLSFLPDINTTAPCLRPIIFHSYNYCLDIFQPPN
ncbi:MAG: hypothetical protein ABI761_15760 [Saprospiraceae bacterium]